VVCRPSSCTLAHPARYNALAKIKAFFAHWIELKSALNHVQQGLANFSTGFRVPFVTTTADVFYQWLAKFEDELVRWAIDNDFDVKGSAAALH
jgi:hypothetical protein